MAEIDPAFYGRAIRRITAIILTLAVLGAAAAASFKGMRIGFSFLAGAGVSYVSFWRWQRVVEAVSPGAKQRSPWSFAIGIFALVALAWVIIKYLGLNIAAAASGLLVSAAAVILEIIYELIYAS